MVMGGDSCPRGRDFESQRCIPDESFFSSICCVKSVNWCLKKRNKLIRGPLKRHYLFSGYGRQFFH